MDSRVATIARYTVLEALRTRLPALVLASAGLLLLASLFVGALAVIETERFEAGFYAAGMRLAGAFIAGIYVLAAQAREFHDKGVELVLALDLERSHYIVGKLGGFTAIAALIALASALPLVLLAEPQAALQWALSFALELAIVVAFALFCMVTFSQLVPAAALLFAFYALARSLTAIRLMGANPVSGAGTLSHEVIAYTVEALALVLPALDGWTRTAWLLGERPAWSALAPLALQSALYVVLLAAAAMFDLHRRNF